MATTKGKTGPDQAAALAKRNQTRETNANLEIDFGSGMAPQEMVAQKAASRSMWPVRILSLRDGVVSGQGEVDTFYKIGEFGTPTGAAAVIKPFRDDPDRLPCPVVLEPRKVGTGTNATSELWALIPSEDYLAALDEDEDEPESE